MIISLRTSMVFAKSIFRIFKNFDFNLKYFIVSSPVLTNKNSIIKNIIVRYAFDKVIPALQCLRPKPTRIPCHKKANLIYSSGHSLTLALIRSILSRGKKSQHHLFHAALNILEPSISNKFAIQRFPSFPYRFRMQSDLICR